MARNRRLFGSIRQLPSGRYQARYLTPAGQTQTAPKTFRTENEADNWLAETQVQIRRNQWVNPLEKTDLLEYMKDWIIERDLKTRTRELYEGYLRNHVAPYFKGAAVEDIRVADIRRWRARLREQGNGEPTIAKCYSVLASVFATAIMDQLVTVNPCQISGARNYEQQERPFADRDEAVHIAEVIEPRFQLLILIAVFGQLRFGEMGALRRQDFVVPDDDESDLVVRVNRSLSQTRNGSLEVITPKSTRGRRQLTLPSTLKPAVVHHLATYAEPGPTGLVFMGARGGRLRGQNFNRVWRRTLIKAGIDPELHLHDLRHTGGTLVARTGATVQELMTRLGHSSPRAAMIYQHSTRARDKEIAAGLEHLVKWKG